MVDKLTHINELILNKVPDLINKEVEPRNLGK